MPSPITSLNQLPAASPHSHTSRVETTGERRLTVLETHGYYLGKTIGSGSYATVRYVFVFMDYKVAQSERHDGNVAVKIVSKFTAPTDYLKKFLPREIEVVKGLKHPNLIRFLQAIETTHRVYIVMEYAENGSLLDIIRRDSYIDEGRARKWFRQLLEAVDYCHERGVVHRDIKCENLLMDKAFNIKLSDFGFARGHLKPKHGQLPYSETFCGSYAYASPEILRGVPYQPQQSDIWSMGVVLYAMVFGRLPFDDANYNLLLKQVSSKINFPRDPKVTMTCKALIIKILAPLKSRVKMNGIRNDSWYSFTPGDKPGTSRQSSDSEGGYQSAGAVGGPEVFVPNLLTKEQLKAEALPRDKNRAGSTDEETPLGLQMPDDATTDSDGPYRPTSGNKTRKHGQ
ncbi:testis-specific serine/threonine-protein kinase 4-like isoform X2 [Photinus pyralis]|uniref:Protein kinase domain-containing protein n=1 Tax=Photinus pyralis TaxID=7054 RepID=A0A1Y1L9I8_PHOPY|nr:testis-specific serine/threonine-protein kinase 4-like isoform X2 [Photinus pyralis]